MIIPDELIAQVRRTEELTRIATEEQAPAVAEQLSLMRKMLNLADSMGEVASAAITNPTRAINVPPEVYAQRLEACTGCEFHSPDGNLGLGECTHPSCGCTKIKLTFAALQCPLDPPRWGIYVA